MAQVAHSAVPTRDVLEATFKETYRQHAAELEATQFGSYVVVQVTTGEFVVAPTPDEAMAKAEMKFGSRDYCWSRIIGWR